jgi:hypothetical protein
MPHRCAAHDRGRNLTAGLVYDRVSGELVVIGPVGGSGVGVALIGAGAEVGSAYVLGRAIRPDQTSVSNGSGSTAVSGASAKSESSANAAAAASNNTEVNVKSSLPPGQQKKKKNKNN